MNASEVHVKNLSKTVKEHRAALANPERRGEPYSQETLHAEQRTKPWTSEVPRRSSASVQLLILEMLLTGHVDACYSRLPRIN